MRKHGELFNSSSDDNDQGAIVATDNKDDNNDDGYPAYSHHDKIPPGWGIVSNDEGGNVPVSKTHHTP